ncbi:MAG: aryl-sulfate sulfotransferase [Terriglobia bacterium]
MGTVDNTGLYTAPTTLPVPNTVTLRAASVTDPTQSAAASVTIVNPAPVLSSISPATINAGSGNTTLTVTGTGFSAQSVVELGSTALATTYGSATQLSALVPAAQLANAGSLAVAVTTPAPGGGTSSALTLAVLVVVAVNPAAPTVMVGQVQQFTANVTGSTNQGATWSVDGVAGGYVTVGTVDNTGLYTAPAVPPAPNTVTLTAASVTDPTRSAAATVTIVNPAPVASTILPATINAGSGNTTLTVTGTGFSAQSVVELGSTALATTYGSATQLSALVPAAQLANAGSLAVAVTTPAPGGGTSSALTLAVLVVVVVNPPAQTVMVGQTQQFTDSVTGSSNQGATWSVDGVAGGNTTLGTIDNTGLYSAPAVPPVPNVVTVQAASVTDPTRSATALVTVVNPAPIIVSISPATVFALSGATLLTVTGSGFTPQSTLTVNGSAFPATLVSSTELTATMSALMVAQPAAFNLVVSNPAPGGGTSSAATFTVLAQGSVTPTGNPQVALYSFSSPRNASVSIEFGTDTTYGLHTWAQNTPPGGGAVQILVAGMKANTTYHMRADVSFPDGTQFVDTDHTFATGGLPAARVPQISVTNPNGLTPSPGVILLDLYAGPSNQVMVTAVDNAGNLIWYYDYDSSLGVPNPIKLLPNGHMLMNLGGGFSGGPTGTVQEIDLAGKVISQFAVADLNNWLSAAGFSLVVAVTHHDFLPLPNGHLILLVNHVINCTDIPGCVGTASVRGDALVDLDQNHNPVWVWDSFDHLDVNRRPMAFPDWTHSNHVVYSPDDGNLLLSVRDQFWVIKIDYQDGQGSGDVLWRLGAQGDFTLTNGGVDDWFYAQHYATFLSPNSTGVFNLMVFDNGDERGIFDATPAPCGTPGQPACYSRVPIFQVDEVGMTATILWQDKLSPVYSDHGGSAQLLNDNNVVFGIDAPSDDFTGGRYMEVTQDPKPQVVLRMEVSGQNAYQAIHLPSLYPAVQW